MTKIYDEERDAFELDKAGGYYSKHIVAMTKEGLHSKSDIAAELAYRDMVIDELKAQIRAMESTVKSNNTYKLQLNQDDIEQQLLSQLKAEIIAELRQQVEE